MKVYLFQFYILFYIIAFQDEGVRSMYSNEERIMFTDVTKEINNESSNPLVLPFLKDYELVALNTLYSSSSGRDKTHFTSFDRILEFVAYNRTFMLYLRKDLKMVSSDLKVKLKGKGEQIFVEDISQDIKIYIGTANVTSQFSSESSFSANVYGKLDKRGFDGYMNSKEETYYIEPFSKYRSEDIVNGKCIIYRSRDILKRTNDTDHGNQKLEDIYRLMKAKTAYYNFKFDVKDTNSSNSRRRRSVTSRICTLYLLADHTFFENTGGGSVITTVTELLYHIEEADRIFRSTDFNGDVTGDNIGFTTSEITIFTDKDASGYLLSDENLDAYTYLDTFSLYDFSTHCLAIAFTYRDFSDGVVGLAWVASSSPYGGAGGICQYRVRSSYDNKLYSYNTGLVTFVNNGKGIPSYKSALTLAHEIGHSFGSSHDSQDNPLCSPESEYGKFIMHPYTNDGSKPNHNRFSPCSIGSMYPVIVNKGACFLEQTGPVCGNWIKENGEECDCGNKQTCLIMDVGGCCTPSDVVNTPDLPCTFRRSIGKVCSSKLSPCCRSDCTLISNGEKCREVSECKLVSYCNGSSSECPEPGSKADGTLCNGGKMACKNGECIKSLCGTFGLEDCQCISDTDSSTLCLICCQNISTGPCLPISQLNVLPPTHTVIHKTQGEPCNNHNGFCDKTSKCIAKDPDSVLKRLKNVFSGVDDIKTWMKSYWYYVVIGVAGFLFLIMVFVLTKRKPHTTHVDAFRMGRLERVLASATLQRDQQKQKLEDIMNRYDTEIINVQTRMSAVEYTQALARLTMFFPTVPRHVLAKVAEKSSSEDAAIRLLLIKGYPSRRLVVLTNIEK